MVATVPAAIAGAAGESFIEKKLGEPWQIAILLAVFAILLWIADRVPPRGRSRTSAGKARSALGLAQCLALMPGDVSFRRDDHRRALLKLDRDDAARLSFLLLIPIVFGAAVLKGAKVAVDGLPPGSAGPFVVGMIAAAVVGLAAIWGLLGYVRRHTYSRVRRLPACALGGDPHHHRRRLARQELLARPLRPAPPGGS